MGKILEVKNLTVHIKTHKGVVQAVRGVDFYLNEQETLAVVGTGQGGHPQDPDDLPGSHDFPEPDHEGWKTDRGNAERAPQGDE